MMEDAQDGLHEQQDEDQDPNDRVVLGELVTISDVAKSHAAGEALTYPIWEASHTPIPKATM